MAVYAKGHYNKFQAVIYKLISSKGVLNLYLGEKMMNPPTPAQLGEKREKEEREEAVLKKEQLQSFYTLGKNTNTERRRRGWGKQYDILGENIYHWFQTCIEEKQVNKLISEDNVLQFIDLEMSREKSLGQIFLRIFLNFFL